jgi:hypothetical protein
VTQLHPKALGSLFIASYDSQGYGLSKFKLYCDRRSVGQFVLVSGPLWGLWLDFNFLYLTMTFLHVGRRFWRQVGPVIRSAITYCLESRRTHNHILLSHLRLPQPGGPFPCIYIPQEQGGPVIPLGIGFTFRRLLRLAGRSSNLPPPGGGGWCSKQKLVLCLVSGVTHSQQGCFLLVGLKPVYQQ